MRVRLVFGYLRWLFSCFRFGRHCRGAEAAGGESAAPADHEASQQVRVELELSVLVPLQVSY